MNPEQKLKQFIEKNNISAEQLFFTEETRTVQQAAKAANASPKDFIKSVVFTNKENTIVVIISGSDRVDKSKVKSFLNLERKLEIATPDIVLERTGFPAGGVPPFGFNALFLMDKNVLKKDLVLGGGGSINSLIRITPKEIKKANNARIGDFIQ